MASKEENIRLGNASDCEAIAQINNILWPEFPDTGDEIARRDRKRDEDALDPDKPIKWRRWVWEEDGRVVGSGSYNQSPWMYHPRKFEIFVMVHPDYQRRGIGTRLYDRRMKELAAFDPIKLTTWTCPEKTPETPAFLEKRGWLHGMKVWDSKLDLTTWNPAPFQDAIERAESQGIRLMTFAELREQDPDILRKLYEMESEIWKDIPLPDKQTDPGYEWYLRHVIDNPNLYPEAWWVAMDGDRPVALSVLWKDQAGEHLSTGLTGTVRSHRKRGLAMALKVKALGFAKAQGHPWVKTDNEENNIGMIGINKRLGFTDYPSWRGFEMVLGEDEEDSDSKKQ